MTQTAVEWLFDQLPDHLRLSRDGFEMLQQAKEMERQQIMAAHEAGAMNLQGGIDNFNFFQENSHYYNEVYGGSHAE